jgi:hypothetical protein
MMPSPAETQPIITPGQPFLARTGPVAAAYSVAICSNASLAIGTGGEDVEVTPDMRPARRPPDVAVLGQLAVACVTVDV